MCRRYCPQKSRKELAASYVDKDKSDVAMKFVMWFEDKRNIVITKWGGVIAVTVGVGARSEEVSLENEGESRVNKRGGNGHSTP